MKKITIIFLLIALGCKQEKIPTNNITREEIIDDYSVFNQVLPKIGIDYPLCYCSYPDEDPFGISIYDKNDSITQKDKTWIFKRILEKGIDTTKVPNNLYDLLIVPDSLKSKEGLKSIVFDKNKLNTPLRTILIKSKDSLSNSDFYINSIYLSRVVFNKNKTKAQFEITIIRGPMNAVEYEVFCILKNGAWIIEHKTLLSVA